MKTLVMGLVMCLVFLDCACSTVGSAAENQIIMERAAKSRILVPTLASSVADGAKWPPDRIAKSLFRAYLKHKTLPDTPSEERLADFEMNSIEPFEEGKAYLVEVPDYPLWFYFVSFDVKPAASNTTWTTGDGNRTPQGWVRGKWYWIALKKDEGKYVLRFLGHSKESALRYLPRRK